MMLVPEIILREILVTSHADRSHLQNVDWYATRRGCEGVTGCVTLTPDYSPSPMSVRLFHEMKLSVAPGMNDGRNSGVFGHLVMYHFWFSDLFFFLQFKLQIFFNSSLFSLFVVALSFDRYCCIYFSQVSFYSSLSSIMWSFPIKGSFTDSSLQFFVFR